MQHIVYAIGKKENLIPPYDMCYIGVTHRPEKRWKEHSKSSFTVGEYMRKNNLTFEDNMIILFYGDIEQCYLKESEYRPLPFMGLNESIGGIGGYKIPHTEEAKKKISDAHKGRKVPWIHKVVKNRRPYNGSENPSAKKWLLISPNNDKYTIEGNLIDFCEKHEIMHRVLRNYIGNAVPEIKYSGRGGFRPKTEYDKYIRENTTGWQLHLL